MVVAGWFARLDLPDEPDGRGVADSASGRLEREVVQEAGMHPVAHRRVELRADAVGAQQLVDAWNR